VLSGGSDDEEVKRKHANEGDEGDEPVSTQRIQNDFSDES
jgi:hypothetical protein